MSHAAVIARTKECFAKAHQMYGLDLSMVSIRFDLKGKSWGIAGRRDGRYYLRYNMHFILNHLDETLKEVVPHEVAHIVCFMNPRLGRNHDFGWQRVCRALGGIGTRTHNKEVVFGKGCTYEYTADNGQKIRLSETKHKRMQAGKYKWLRSQSGGGTITKNSPFKVIGFAGREFVKPTQPKPAAPVLPMKTIPAEQRRAALQPKVWLSEEAKAILGWNKPPVKFG
jgi:SprT protein